MQGRAMRTRLKAQMAMVMTLWLVVVWLLGAGAHDGLAHFIWAAWTTAGVIYFSRRPLASGGSLAATFVMGLITLALAWWWAAQPSSWIADWRPMLAPVFGGAVLGTATGFWVINR